jgi:acyl carrier protein
MKTQQEFLEMVISEVLSECENKITIESNFKELDCWDSITALTLIALFDSEFDFKLNGDKIRESSSILDLYNLLN